MRTFELLSIIASFAAVGIAFGAVVIGRISDLRTKMRTEMQDFRTDTRAVEARIHTVETQMLALDERLSAVEQRQAKTEGLLEGLRDAITARGAQDPSAREAPA